MVEKRETYSVNIYTMHEDALYMMLSSSDKFSWSLSDMM